MVERSYPRLVVRGSIPLFPTITKEGDALEQNKMQEMFTRHTKTVDLMRQINEEIVQMSPAEFAIYINAVEIPHTEILKTKKIKL